MSMQTMKTAVQSKVTAITKITNVYGVETPPQSSFPYATIVLADSNGEFADTSNNLMRYVFRIRVYYEITRESPTPRTDAEVAVMRILDDLKDAFNADYTLSGTANGGVEVLETSTGYATISSNETRVAEVLLACKELVSVV